MITPKQRQDAADELDYRFGGVTKDVREQIRHEVIVPPKKGIDIVPFIVALIVTTIMMFVFHCSFASNDGKPRPMQDRDRVHQ